MDRFPRLQRINSHIGSLVDEQLANIRNTYEMKNPKPKPLSDALYPAIYGIRNAVTDKCMGLATGYRWFDKTIGGAHGAIVITGLPGDGKSIAAINIALGVGRENRVLILNMENDEALVIRRILSKITKISVDEILNDPDLLFVDPVNGVLHESIETEFLKATKNLYIHTPSNLISYQEKHNILPSMERLLTSYADHLRGDSKTQSGVLIVIDSLHTLVEHSGMDQRLLIELWMKAIVQTKLNHNVSFLVISQMSRHKYKDPGIDLCRESSSIEFGCDSLIHLVHNQKDSILEMIPLKVRDGKKGVIGRFKTQYQFGHIEELPDQESRQGGHRGFRG